MKQHEGDAPTLLEQLAGIRVLVVDDHEETAQMLCSLLSHHGIRTNCVSSSEDALKHLVSFRSDVVISDLGDGITIARSVRAHYDIPAIAITADGKGRTREEALGAGFLPGDRCRRTSSFRSWSCSPAPVAWRGRMRSCPMSQM